MLRLHDVRRKSPAHLRRRNLPIHIGEHIDAPLPLRIHRNPHKRRLIAFHRLDARTVQAVIHKRLDDQPPAVVIPNQSKPSRADSQPPHLRQVVPSNATSVNLQPIRIDLLLRPQQPRHNRKIINPAAPNPHHIHVVRHVFPRTSLTLPGNPATHRCKGLRAYIRHPANCQHKTRRDPL